MSIPQERIFGGLMAVSDYQSGQNTLDPKVGDLAVNGVGDLAEGVGAPHLRLAIRW